MALAEPIGEVEIVASVNTMRVKTQLAELQTQVDAAGSGLGASGAGGAGGAGPLGARGATAEDAAHAENAKRTAAAEQSMARQAAAEEEAIARSHTQKMGHIKNALGSLGVPSGMMNGYAAAGLAIIATVAVTAKMAMGFQTAESAIASSAGISVKAADSIGNAMLATAGKVEFSASEQAKALAPVAGQLEATTGHALKAKEASLFMASAMDLATASSTDLTTTAATLASTMQAFQTPVKGAAHVTDVLFNAARMTGQGIDTVGSTLARLKGRLGATAPAIGDLAALLVTMTGRGITGRAALTGVNGAMTGLLAAVEKTTKSGKIGAKTLAEFGLSATDAHGRITPLSTIIEKLAPRYDKMTQAQQLTTSAQIFGSSAAKAMTQVIDGGAAAYQRATVAVNKQGSAATGAGKMSRTLGVEIKTLKAFVDDLAIKIGTLLIPILTKVARFFVAVINVVIDVVTWFGKHKDVMIALAAAAAAALLPILGPLDLIIAGIALLVAAVYEVIKHWKVISHFFTQLWHQVEVVFFTAWHAVESAMLAAWHFIDNNVLHPIVHGFVWLWDHIVSFGKDIWNFAQSMWQPLYDGFIAVANAIIVAYDDTIGWLPGMHVNTLGNTITISVNDQAALAAARSAAALGVSVSKITHPIGPVLPSAVIGPQSSTTRGSGVTNNYGPVTLNVHGHHATPQEIAREISFLHRSGQLTGGRK